MSQARVADSPTASEVPKAKLALIDAPVPRFVWLLVTLFIAGSFWAARGDSVAQPVATPAPPRTSLPAQWPTAGADLFLAAGCASCHATVGRSTKLGPSLAGALKSAEARLADPGYAGQAATPEEYLVEATVDHCRDLIPGYSCAGVPDYGVMLTGDQVSGLVQFLVGLAEGGG